MEDVLAELSGRPDDLLSFHDVHEQLDLGQPVDDARLEEVPLYKIVGSVGRYRDFTRAFLPRDHIDPQRWTRVERLHRRAVLPPVDLFRVGDAYFVRDGHHRVSVARAQGQKTIQARVVDVPARVPLDAAASPADLILKSGYTEFLAATGLDASHPAQRIELTEPGGYRRLLQHVEVHQFYMGLRSRHYPTLAEAAADWYQYVYLPVIERIRDSGILAHFAGRTEADLYVWVAENHARLQMRYATQQEAEDAVADFRQAHGISRFRRWLRRLLHRLFPRFVARAPGTSQPASPPD
jgi:uncharacterized ParB-like nuclease family protein